MSIKSLFRAIPSRDVARPRAGAKPRCECLEGRRLLSWASAPPSIKTPKVTPSAFTSTTLSNHGHMELAPAFRYTYFQAPASGTYTFDLTATGSKTQPIFGVYNQGGNLLISAKAAQGSHEVKASVALVAGQTYTMLKSYTGHYYSDYTSTITRPAAVPTGDIRVVNSSSQPIRVALSYDYAYSTGDNAPNYANGGGGIGYGQTSTATLVRGWYVLAPNTSADLYADRSNSTQYAMAIKNGSGTYVKLDGTFEQLPVENSDFNTSNISSYPAGWTAGSFYQMNTQTYTIS